ncbi:MAG: GNA1162 family protein [Pseudomonadota bacterium]
MKTTFCALLIAVFLTGCVTQPTKKDMSAFRDAAPRSILVVPTINKSLDVDAPNYVLAALPLPIAEKGYYVFPVNTTKYVLEQEGFYEGEQIHRQPTESLAKLFGADAVLYVSINRWDAQYALITTVVTVEFDYRLVAKDGTEIWKENKSMQYSPQNNNSGSALGMLISAVVNAAVARAAPNYMPLTQQANRQVFVMGVNPLPDGPYKTIAVKP